MRIGMVGLGRMGANMARRLLKGGHQVVVFDRSPKPVEELVKENAIAAVDLRDLASKLEKPRAIWLMVPAAAMDNVIADLVPHLESGDILIDGGNSYFVMTSGAQRNSRRREFTMWTWGRAAASGAWKEATA